MHSNEAFLFFLLLNNKREVHLKSILKCRDLGKSKFYASKSLFQKSRAIIIEFGIKMMLTFTSFQNWYLKWNILSFTKCLRVEIYKGVCSLLKINWKVLPNILHNSSYCEKEIAENRI